MRPFLALVLLFGCTGPAGTDTDTGGGADTDTDPDPADETSDEALVRALIAGERTPDEVFPAIAWSGGFPVATDGGTHMFVHWHDGGTWSLAGDFNDWDPEPMTRGDGFWWAEVAIAEPAGQIYKLVDGGEYQADPFARSYGYDGFGEFSYVAPPADAPRLDRWPGLTGEDLAARDVRVYVPSGDGPWPVLYLHDGQNLFDPGALHGGWALQDAVARVGEEVLLVGLDNTADRLEEYAHAEDDVGWGPMTGRADDYAALLHETLRPHVEATYGSTGLDGVMGSSMGGLVSLYVALAYPGDYDFAGSLSGTLGWGRFTGDGPVMEELYRDQGVGSAVLYVDSGGSDGGDGCTDPDGDGFPVDDPNDSDNYCTNRQFADAMAEIGYTWDADLFHWHEAGATHDEAAWAARVDLPLSVFLGLE